MVRAPLMILVSLLLLPALSWADKDAALSIGDAAPTFKLEGTDGKKHALTDYTEEAGATIVVFTCNTCPYSKAYEPVLIDMAEHYADKPVQFVLINSNDPERKPGDSFEAMVERANDKGFPFPYLFDATQKVARSYGATKTPHVFLVDREQVLRYRGRINDHQDPEKTKVHDLMRAVDAVLAGEEVEVTETRAFGCGIKWKKASS